jgi:D-Tyr-tRNAtyr deacylase
MIAVIQRVTKASVTIEDRVMSEIGNGYVILLEIFEDDT